MQACFSLLKPCFNRAAKSTKLPVVLVLGTGVVGLWGLLWMNGSLSAQTALYREESQQRLRQVQSLVRFHIKSPMKRLKRFTQFLDQQQITYQLHGKKGGISNMQLTVSERDLELVLERLRRDHLQLGSLDLTVGKEQHNLGFSLVFK